MCCQHYKEELRIHRESVLGETSRSTDKKKVITHKAIVPFINCYLQKKKKRKSARSRSRSRVSACWWL